MYVPACARRCVSLRERAQDCPGFITLAPMKLCMRRSLRIYLCAKVPSLAGRPAGRKVLGAPVKLAQTERKARRKGEIIE